MSLGRMRPLSLEVFKYGIYRYGHHVGVLTGFTKHNPICRLRSFPPSAKPSPRAHRVP